MLQFEKRLGYDNELYIIMDQPNINTIKLLHYFAGMYQLSCTCKGYCYDQISLQYMVTGLNGRNGEIVL